MAYLSKLGWLESLGHSLHQLCLSGRWWACRLSVVTACWWDRSLPPKRTITEDNIGAWLIKCDPETRFDLPGLMEDGEPTSTVGLS